MITGWRAPAAGLRHAPARRSAWSRSPGPAAGQPAAGAADGGAAGPGRRQVRLIFSALMLGMLLAALDQTIVATALPTITGELHGLNHIGWVVTAYLLAVAAAFVLALILKEIPLRTRGQRDTAQAAPAQPGAPRRAPQPPVRARPAAGRPHRRFQ
jgi:hypothetical protein